MKDRLRNIAEIILLAIGICAAVSIMGTVGGIEYDNMTLAQRIRQLLVAAAFLVFSCAGYYVLDF